MSPTDILAMVAVATAVYFLLRAEKLRLRVGDERDRADAARMLGMEKESWLRDSLREQAARHDAEMQRVAATHEQERAAWKAQVESLAKMMQSAVGVAAFGGQPREAKVIPQPPDAEARVQRRIREETIQAGAAQIMADYKKHGLEITDEEAREQAIAFVNGDVSHLFGGA